jgi:alpha-beta hydrolase superfamily lysophospholipase
MAAFLVACPSERSEENAAADIPADHTDGIGDATPAADGGVDAEKPATDGGQTGGDKGGTRDPGAPPEPGPPPTDPREPPLPVLGTLIIEETKETWSVEDTAEYIERWAPAVEAKHGVSIHRLLYTTYNPPGAQNQASGLAVLPHSPSPAEAPVAIAWAHGTWGTADSCTPSLKIPLGAYFGIVFASMGYAVVLPDYPGLGTPGPHPYLVRDVTGIAVADSLRALLALGEKLDRPVSPRAFVLGHSQGGHAALSARPFLEGPYGEGIDLLGAVAFAPAGAFKRLFEGYSTRTGPPSPFFVLAWHAWLSRAGLPVTEVFKPPYDRLVPQWAESYCLDDVTANLPGDRGLVYTDELEAAFRDGFSTLPHLGKIALDHSAPRFPAATPLLLLQGDGDTLIWPKIADWIADQACDANAGLELELVPDLDHAGIVDPEQLLRAHEWVQARLAGESWENGCGEER